MSAKVFHRERLPPRMQPFADDWERDGTFDITCVSGSRNDAMQLVEFKKGRLRLPSGKWLVIDKMKIVTEAMTAIDSAHGHDAAGDFLPVRSTFATSGLPATVYLGDEEDPVARAEAIRLFIVMGRFAKDRGYESGIDYPHFDGPHVCLQHWRSLPVTSC